MTDAQKKWLDAHPEHRPVGPRCGHFQYVRTGWLYPSGDFLPGVVMLTDPEGAFQVGVLEATDAPPSDGFVRLR